MGGNFNELGGVTNTTGFSLFRPYDHVTVTYDNFDRVTNAIYYKNSSETIILQEFLISYSSDGWPIENGTEYKNHQFDIYRGRFVLNSNNKNEDNDGFKQIVRGSCKQKFNNCGQNWELVSNSINQSIKWLTSPEIISVVSTSSEDRNSGGSGIRDVLITGIDGSGSEITENILLNGITPVNSVLNFLRINKIQAVSNGDNEVAVGKITFTTNVTNILLDSISAGYSMSASLKYTIPNSHKLIVKAFRVSADRLGEYEVKLMIWQRSPSLPPYAYIHTVINSQSELHLFPGELVLNAQTDFAAVIKKRSGKNGESLFTAELLGTQTILV